MDTIQKNIISAFISKAANKKVAEKIAEKIETMNFMSDEDFVKFKCDRYNQEVGNLNDFDGYNCDVCRNKGLIEIPRCISGQWVEMMTECKCKKTRQSIRRMQRSGLEKIIKKYHFENYEATEQWQKVLKQKAMSYTKDENAEWFFIGGQPGAGKTHLCTAISREFLLKGNSVLYMLWRDEMSKLKNMMIDNPTQYQENLQNYKTVEILYIDDLFKIGKGALPTAADIQITFEILNYRYNSNLKTIISSEKTIEEIIDIDEATGSRISERTIRTGYGFNINKDKSKNYRIKSMTNL